MWYLFLLLFIFFIWYWNTVQGYFYTLITSCASLFFTVLSFLSIYYCCSYTEPYWLTFIRYLGPLGFVNKFFKVADKDQKRLTHWFQAIEIGFYLNSTSKCWSFTLLLLLKYKVRFICSLAFLFNLKKYLPIIEKITPSSVSFS